jgi:hypothetical protein
MNMSPRVHTLPIIAAERFKRYCDRQFLHGSEVRLTGFLADFALT